MRLIKKLLSIQYSLIFVIILLSAGPAMANETATLSSPVIWIYETESPDEKIISYAISKDGNYIVASTDFISGSIESNIYLFNKNSREWIWKYSLSGTRVSFVCVSDDGEYILAKDEFNAYIFHKNSNIPLRVMDDPGVVTFSGDGEYIVSVKRSELKLYLRSETTPLHSWTLDYTEDFAGSISFLISRDGGNIVAGYHDFFLFQKTLNEPSWTVENYHAMDMSNDGSLILARKKDDIKLTSLFLNSNSTPVWNYNYLSQVKLSDDGNYIAAAQRWAGKEKQFLLFSKDSNEPVWIYPLGSHPQSISISDDGALIAGVCDNSLYLFNNVSANPLWIYGNEPWTDNQEFYDAKISGNGKYIAAIKDNKLTLLSTSHDVPSEVWVDDDYCETCINDGHVWGHDAFNTIQKGVDVLYNGGTVHVSSGIYYETVDTNYGGYALTVHRDNIHIIGECRETTIIDGDQDANRIAVSGKGFTIENFTIRNSGINYSGILLLNNDGTSKIKNNILDNNYRGICFEGNGSIIVEDNIIINSSSSGIMICVFSVEEWPLKTRLIKNNIIKYNETGISLNSDQNEVNNNIIAYNSNGISASNSFQNSYTNNTIVYNEIGIYYYNSVNKIKNSIIYYNRNNYLGSSKDLGISYSDVEGGYEGEGNISLDPLLIDPENGDFRLRDYSPCIGAANIYEAPETDLNGDPRPNPPGSLPDMGAIENRFEHPLNSIGDIDNNRIIELRDVILVLKICVDDKSMMDLYKESDKEDAGEIGLKEAICILQNISGN